MLMLGYIAIFLDSPFFFFFTFSEHKAGGLVLKRSFLASGTPVVHFCISQALPRRIGEIQNQSGRVYGRCTFWSFFFLYSLPLFFSLS